MFYGSSIATDFVTTCNCSMASTPNDNSLSSAQNIKSVFWCKWELKLKKKRKKRKKKEREHCKKCFMVHLLQQIL